MTPTVDRVTQTAEITAKILTTKKYRLIYPGTVRRIVEESLERYTVKEAEKQARAKLHQIWGAFVNQTNYDKVLDSIKSRIESGEDIEKILTDTLSLQSSTRERVPIIDNFYTGIFEKTGPVNSIVDYGSGLNPLTYSWMGQGIQYAGFDIDLGLNDFVSSVLSILSLGDIAQVSGGDVLIDPPIKADVSFYLKLIPILEQQEKGSTARILENSPSQHLVVSFPTKSIGGKLKNMREHYSEWFTSILTEKEWPHDILDFESELVFVIHKD